MTNLAFELDPLELEDEEAELGEQSGSAKTSVSSVTTPPPHGKLIPFFKKVILAGFWQEGEGSGPRSGAGGGGQNGFRCGTSLILWGAGPPAKEQGRGWGVGTAGSSHSPTLARPQEGMVLAVETLLPGGVPPDPTTTGSRVWWQGSLAPSLASPGIVRVCPHPCM